MDKRTAEEWEQGITGKIEKENNKTAQNRSRNSWRIGARNNGNSKKIEPCCGSE
jgi:hypothetical protein